MTPSSTASQPPTQQGLVPVDFVRLSTRMRDEREAARTNLSAPDVAYDLFAYVDRIVTFELDDRTASDVVRGLQLRHNAIAACVGRGDTAAEHVVGLRLVMESLCELKHLLIVSDDMRHEMVGPALAMLQHEITLSFPND
jgi:hypothetical protein